MKNQRLCLSLTLFAAVLAAPLPALAQPVLTYVSALTGTDAGSCPITAPCATLAYAFGQTNVGGEIDVLSDGNYSQATLSDSQLIITSGITIDGGGHHVTLTNFGPCSSSLPTGNQAAICVIAGTFDVITLRNLTLNLQVGFNAFSASHPNYGIAFVGGQILRVENTTIDGLYAPFSGEIQRLSYGIDALFGDVILSNVRILNASYVQAGASIGAAVLANGSGVRVSLNDSNLSQNDNGVVVQNGATAQVNHCVIAFNLTGVSTSGGAAAGGTIRLNASSVTDNTTGLQITGTKASLLSFGNNVIYGNKTNGAPTGIVALQ